jgi:hypothetical protein
MSVPAGTVGISEIHREYLPAVIKAANEISARMGASYHPNGQWESAVSNDGSTA